MKLLLLSGVRRTRTMVRRLFRQSGHLVVCREKPDEGRLDADEFDLVLVDGQPGRPVDTRDVRRVVDSLRDRGLPVVVLSVLDEAQNALPRATCMGGPGSARRCPLSEMAFGETEALLLASLARPAGEPVTFVYQG